MWVPVVAACELSYSVACGILVPQPWIKLASPALEGEFLTTGPPGKSPKLSVSTLSHFTWAFMKHSAFRIVSLLIWWFWAPRERKEELPNLLKATPESSLSSLPPYCWSTQSQTSLVQGDTDPSIFQWEECQGICSNLKSATISKIGK